MPKLLYSTRWKSNVESERGNDHTYASEFFKKDLNIRIKKRFNT